MVVRNCGNVDEVGDFDAGRFWTRKLTWHRDNGDADEGGGFRDGRQASVRLCNPKDACDVDRTEALSRSKGTARHRMGGGHHSGCIQTPSVGDVIS
jgi:hypothetical protein